MSGFHIAVVPVGKIRAEELDAAAGRVAKGVHQAVEVRSALPIPHGTEDVGRGQHRAASFLQRLSAEVRKLKPGRMVGGGDGEQTPLKPDGVIFVTDVDLFTAKTDGAFGVLNGRLASAVVSVRRQRESFYNRRADPARQRVRLTKELLRMYGRLRGLPECSDPECVLAVTRTPRDLDLKEERFCRSCEARLFEGRIRV